MADSALFKKLKIQSGTRICVLHDSEKKFGKLPAGVESATALKGEFALILTFATEKKSIVAEAPRLAKALEAEGILWVCYPKAKGLKTDLNRDVLRESLAELGLEAVSIVSMDDVWSALRFKVVS